MSRPLWSLRTALATAAAATLLVAAAQMANADQIPGPLPTVTVPPTPTVTVKPPPTTPPRVKPPAVKPPPVRPPTAKPKPVPTGAKAPSAPGGAPNAGGGSLPGGGSAPGGTPQLPVSPGNAAAIIGANPGADLYPQPPVDAATTPQARQVAALSDVQHRIQYLNNILARTQADLATVQRQSNPVPQLIAGITGPSSAPQDALDPANTPAGRFTALSAAINSGQTELVQRNGQAAALQKAISQAVQPTVRAPVTPAATPTQYTGGKLLMPVRGHLTSNFGVRFDPYYHVWQLHPGVDLAAPIGTPITAAAGGRVTWVGWKGGYGNYTCIDHGRADNQRFSTCYGHQSKILVALGQQVRAGQVIGQVGSTGASTGPHLHFEVRLGGRPVNPLPWL